MSRTLTVTVVEAKNLMAKDWNGFSDPYAILEFGKQRHKTKTQKKTIQPLWNETFVFAAENHNDTTLRIVLKDYDRFSRDDSLGETTVNTGTLYRGVEADMWLPLQRAKRGEVRIRLRADGFGMEQQQHYQHHYHSHHHLQHQYHHQPLLQSRPPQYDGYSIAGWQPAAQSQHQPYPPPQPPPVQSQQYHPQQQGYQFPPPQPQGYQFPPPPPQYQQQQQSPPSYSQPPHQAQQSFYGSAQQQTPPPPHYGTTQNHHHQQHQQQYGAYPPPPPSSAPPYYRI